MWPHASGACPRFFLRSQEPKGFPDAFNGIPYGSPSRQKMPDTTNRSSDVARMALIAGHARKLVDHGNMATLPGDIGSYGVLSIQACITV